MPMKGWGTARVDWREPPAMWIGLGWLAATLWPPLPVTWLLWPASQSSLAQLLDWRVLATVMGGFGAAVRLAAYGCLFSVLCALILAVLGALWTAIFATGDIVRRMAEFKASLIVGLAFMPAALVVGVSYSVWAGVAASLIAFAPRGASHRPSNHFLADRLLPLEETEDHGPHDAGPEPEPLPPLPPP